MHCPFCSASETKVNDSRLVADGNQVRRRRECLSCSQRFTTYESVELAMPRVVKKDGSRQVFDDNKLRAGLQRALQKRPVDTEAIEGVLTRIKHQCRSTGEREIPSVHLGELAMQELKQLDPVAYIRFASVYRQFEDIEEFKAEINQFTSSKDS